MSEDVNQTSSNTASDQKGAPGHMKDDGHGHGDGQGWADNPKFIRIFVGILIVASIAVALAGFNPAWQNPHPHFDGEKMGGFGDVWQMILPVFFAIWGFAAFMFIVLAGQHLRKLVARKEDYYDEFE